MELIRVTLLYFLACAVHVAGNNVIRLEPSTSPPPNTSSVVDPSFAGFGIEASNLFSFTGAAQPNGFTLNLLNNLANYTGKPSHIRIGGNTQDYMTFREDHNDWTWIENPNADHPGASDSMIIGPRFFETANRLPKGTTVTWGLNLAYEQDDYIQQITTMAKQAISGLSNLNITSFEIGNEPDLYLKNGLRTGEWGGKVYTAQWLERASAIYKQVLQPASIPSAFFEAAATASTIGTDFQIINLIGFDIFPRDGSAATPYLSGWNQHDYYYYIGVSGYPVTLEHLMKLQTTEEQFVAWAQQVKQAQQTPYPYSLREMGVVGPIGLDGVTDVFGAALWTLNFLCYMASLGVSSVGFHMTDNSNASAWQPIPMYGQPAHVRPLYYGVAAFDQVIGCSSAVRIAQLQTAQVPPEYVDFVRAYAVYQEEQLASVVVVNGKIANISEAQKTSATVQLQLPSSSAGQAVYLSYLTNSGADATVNTTWDGFSFEQNGDGIPVRISNEEHTVRVGSDGTASFSVRDSEAVVASIGGKVGCVEPIVASFPESPSTTSGVDSPAPSATSSSGANRTSNSNDESGAAAPITTVFACLLPWGPGLIAGFLML
ncbi:glycoside hydrolase superfamily [Hypomontagnella monticulosa]|nr:glycoside hydrolase superfamily [Hypomontagnella monticulosa]